MKYIVCLHTAYQHGIAEKYLLIPKFKILTESKYERKMAQNVKPKTSKTSNTFYGHHLRQEVATEQRATCT